MSSNSNDHSTDLVESSQKPAAVDFKTIHTGAERLALYRPLLINKRVGLVVNHTSTIGEKHLLDSLLELDINVVSVFAPEHGFRGTADAGEEVKNGRDAKTNVPIVSLYGAKKGPEESDMEALDILVFDIQDVGARFYTYISTMHYVMEACAAFNKPLIILDRPNPNGHYIDGPVLDPKFKSFVGMHPIPVVHGLTVGELGKMINGQGWLKDSAQCDLTVIECSDYARNLTYRLPVRPSPNLPNLRSIYLYPSLCFLEPTIVSIGRGTDKQFQVIGHPEYNLESFSYTPTPKPGAMHPKLEGKVCKGEDFSKMDPAQVKDWKRINLNYLIKYYKALKGKDFFTSTSFFDKLAGTDQLRMDLEAGLDEEAIRKKWADGLEEYANMREQYLLYD